MTHRSEAPTKVGVLFVHGIGEQRQFEHLETEVRNIITAIQSTTDTDSCKLRTDPEGKTRRTVRVVVNALSSATYDADQQIWQDGDRAPVMAEVIDIVEDSATIKATQIYFHQVWWADLDEPSSLWTQLRFWLWGLSLWTIDGKFDSKYPGCRTRMQLPGRIEAGQGLRLWDRVRLFWVALVILLILPVLSLLNAILRKVLNLKIPGPDILAQYIGDVKLYQQADRVGKGPLQDLGQPPRVTIRRRMIRAMVEMALRDYDRWYILAHSQGTVVAFNSLMESAQALPNYLTEELWTRALEQSLIRPAKELSDQGVAEQDERLTPAERHQMQPDFPSWRNKDCILDRQRLFARLRGVLTYGSPLSKFAALWPVIVPLNQEREVFAEDFRWLNVYDPSDPVAGQTKPYQPEENPFGVAELRDIAYKADSFHLLSHIEYLTFSKNRSDRLVNKVADWLLTGQAPTLGEGTTGWLTPVQARVYVIVRVATWIILALVLGFGLSKLLLGLVFSLLNSPSSLQFSRWFLRALTVGIAYILLATLVVLLTGTLVKLFVRDLSKL